MLPEHSQWIPPAVIVGHMLYLHRTLPQDVKNLRDRMSCLEERMARLEGTLDVLREFFVRNSHGTVA